MYSIRSDINTTRASIQQNQKKNAWKSFFSIGQYIEAKSNFIQHFHLVFIILRSSSHQLNFRPIYITFETTNRLTVLTAHQMITVDMNMRSIYER